MNCNLEDLRGSMIKKQSAGDDIDYLVLLGFVNFSSHIGGFCEFFF